MSTTGTFDSAPARRRIVVSAVIILLLLAVVVSRSLHETFLALTAKTAAMMDQQPTLGTIVFVGLAALSAILAFFSSAVLVPTALMHWGPTATMFLLWSGWTVGGTAAYWLARLIGRPLLRSLTSQKVLGQYQRQISRHSSMGVVFLFQMVLPSEIPGYVLGSAAYPFWKYLVVLVLSELPYAWITVTLGTSLLERQVWPLVAIAIGGAALAFGAVTLLERRLGHGKTHPDETVESSGGIENRL